MNKEDLSNMEVHGVGGLRDYQKLVDFASDCIAMDETHDAMRALKLLSKYLNQDISNHGVIMID